MMRVLFLEEQESPIFLGENAHPGFPASSSSDSYFEPSPSGNCLLNSLHIRFYCSIYLDFADSSSFCRGFAGLWGGFAFLSGALETEVAVTED